MDQNERLERINELSRKERETGLTEKEKEEQASLREEYRIAFREGLRGRLENTYLLRPDGTREKLRKNGQRKKETLKKETLKKETLKKEG